MSAGDLGGPAGRGGRSGRGRGHFSAVANVAGSDQEGLTPRSPGGDLISFDDLGDSDAQRLRSVFPAPASSVGSSVSAVHKDLTSPERSRGCVRGAGCGIGFFSCKLQ